MFTLLIQDQNIFNGTNNLKLMKAIKEIGKIDNEIIGLKNEQSVLKKEILLDNLKLIENTSTHYKLTEYEKEILIFLSTPETQMAFNYDFKKIIKDEEFLLSLITRISFTLRLEFDMYNKK